jgi:alpha-tubulin suppressor-like RCC1 family protein
MKKWLQQVRADMSQERAEARRSAAEDSGSSQGASGQAESYVASTTSSEEEERVREEGGRAEEVEQEEEAERVRDRRQRAGKNSYFEFMERPSYLFVWGEGAWGKLGLGGGDEWSHPPDEPEPRQCLDDQLRGKQITRVVCHKRHTYVLTGACACARVRVRAHSSAARAHTEG